MKNIALFLLVVGLACIAYAKPHGPQSKGGSRLEHELTNRALHVDRSRHTDHHSLHHTVPAKRQHNRPAEHAVRKKLLIQHQQEDEILQGERLMHERARLPVLPLHNNTVITSGSTRRKTGILSKKAQKFAQVVAQAKATSAAKARFFNQEKSPKISVMTKEYKTGSLVKEYKGHRSAKKFNPKKHSFKKSAHKEKFLRNRQLKRELKARSLQNKKEKVINKELLKAKELLRKEKAFKKKERREKRAKVMSYRKKM